MLYSADIETGRYDGRDVERVRTNNEYLKCFIRSFYDSDGGAANMNVVLEKLDTVLTFRNKISLNGGWSCV